MKFSTVLGSLSLLVALSACGGAQTEGAQSPESSTGGGSVAADFTSRDVDGNTVRLSDYLGKQVVLLNFWGTFCEPCLAEFPHINRMYAENKDKGFVVLAISMDGPETVAQVPSFVKRNALNFTVVYDDDSHIASLYNPKKSAPLSVLIDKSGKVVHTHEGYNPGDEEVLEREIKELL